MRPLVLFLSAFLVAPFSARAEVRVATTLPALGALAREVVGANGTVTVLAPPDQDPHFVDGKPTLILALNRAQLLVHAGGDLEAGWLPTLLSGARNGDIQPGRPGNLDVSTLTGPLLEVPEKVDRALGDVHPRGNPHVWLDPRRARKIALGIAERLASLDAERAAAYRDNARRFVERLDEKIAAWEERMRPHRGRGFVPYHKSLTYLADWLGLAEVATVEPVPGIAPSPSHLARLILEVRKREPRPVVVAERWHNQRIARTVAEKAGVPLVVIPGDVGSTRENGDYISFMEDLLRRLAAGFEAAEPAKGSAPQPTDGQAQ
ncbi:MAG: metal ABC transporter substrate-binding protein [Pseudomonadota bacterium]|nr:MAG: ABC transporter substrate-binding protein [Pseudomonadota bacterium]